MIHRKKIQPEVLKGKGEKKSRGNFQDFLIHALIYDIKFFSPGNKKVYSLVADF